MSPEQTMTALMLTGVRRLELLELPVPRLEEADDVLIRVRAVGVCGSDVHGYAGTNPRRVPPLIMGHEAVGEVVATAAVASPQVGSRVATHTIVPCRDCARCLAGQEHLCEQRVVLGMNAPGAYAGYVRWKAASLSLLPDGLSDVEATLAEPLSVAVHAASLTPDGPDDVVYVAGAGPIGLLLLCVLRRTSVRAIVVGDPRDDRLETARRLGADATINPVREHPARALQHRFGERAALAFEASGAPAAVRQTIEAVRSGGTVVWIGNSERTVEVDVQEIVGREIAVRGSYCMRAADFERALALLAEGAVPTGELVTGHGPLTDGPAVFEELAGSSPVIKHVFVP